MLALRTIVCGLLLSVSALAAPPVRLGVELADGSNLRGKVSTESVPLHAVMGKMDIPWGAVASIEFKNERGDVTVRLRNGDVLSGSTSLASLDLQTIVGQIKVVTAQCSKITVLGAVPSGGKLVLWNTLGSKEEIYRSKVGPAGAYRGEGGRFEQGKFGGALVVSHSEKQMVSFPREVISPKAGCIELWGKLIDFPQELVWGENPALFKVFDSKRCFGIHLNGNDGASNGGLCGWAGTFGSCGTGRYGRWTYEQVFGAGKVGDWHHYALVWDKNGIPEVGEGKRKYAIFLDGKLNTGRWEERAGDDFTPLTEGELVLMTTQHLRQGSIAFDNIKAWNYAKTDFSDRFEEAGE